jgi:hypothetical protein
MQDDVFASDPMASPQSMNMGGAMPAQFSREVLSKKIKGRQRTFFIDLKESANGKFVKISELSRGGQRSTIMFDAEDMDPFLEALQEMKAAL